MTPTQSPTVIVVEPDHRVRPDLHEALRAQGWTTHLATDGEAAFTLLLRLPACACLVVDAEISPLTARGLLERARMYARFHRVPVVLLGGAPGDESLAVTRRVDAQAAPHTVVEAVRASLRWSQVPRSSSSEGAAS
jgi:DNA-binding response OmpR family regulator